MTERRLLSPRGALSVGVFAAAVLGLTSCSSGSASTGSSSSGGLPSTINIVADTSLSGSAGFVGTAQVEGAQVAVRQINGQRFLGSSKLVLKKQDTTSVAQVAASQMTQLVSQKDVPVVLGSPLASDAVAQAPIGQTSGLPIVFTEATGSGVILGNLTYRASPTLSSIFHVGLKYVLSQHLTKMGIIYLSSSPAYQDVVDNTIKAGASTYGYRVVASAGVSATTTDFSAPVSKVLSAKPDVVVILVIGASTVTALNQLRSAGYHGLVLTQAAVAGGTLIPAGQAADNVVWPTGFTYVETGGAAANFTAMYEKAYKEPPLAYAANGYDAIWMIARAIKASGDASRTGVEKGLESVARQGFTGAQGHITFVHNSAVVPGILSTWDVAAKKEKVIR